LEIAKSAESKCTNTNPEFTVFDDVDQPTDGTPFAMYSPPRSVGGNCHIIKMLSNTAEFTLTADVTGTVGSTALAEKLDLWFSGFWGQNGLSGGQSTQWELASDFSRVFDNTFFGESGINYRLRLDDVPAPAQVNGQVTYTMVGN
jgi:hypothetical protein